MTKLIYDFTNLLSENIGSQNGVSRQQITDMQPLANKVLEAVFSQSTEEHNAVFDILDNVDLAKIKSLAADVREKCENFVVLGIGGSALGSLAIFDALVPAGHNFLDKKDRTAPRFFVEDSIDPEVISGLLDTIELSETVFCVVSKSGKTVETMTQFLYIRDLCEQRLGGDWVNHFVVLTDDNQNFLHNYAFENNLRLLTIPTKLGGRYSVLSVVGLFPAAVLGLDVDALIGGAKMMLEHCKNANVWQNAPMLSALINFWHYQNGKNMTVLIPYSETLNVFDDWFCQLWGESIGRDLTRDGQKLVGTARIGQTPIQVTGPSVQHSQFQLYLEGPDDKTFTFVGIQKFKNDLALPKMLNQIFGKEVSKGRTFGDLLNVERVSSESALKMFGKPNETILVEKVDEQVLGKMFMFFVCKMLFTAEMLNITPFGQPAVESIKREVARIIDAEPSICGDNTLNI